MSEDPFVVFQGEADLAEEALRLLQEHGIRAWIVHDVGPDDAARTAPGAWGVRILVDASRRDEARERLHAVGMV
ncbi:MAG: hypothetical protein R3F30_10480 [Planctomycetota bacterium]